MGRMTQKRARWESQVQRQVRGPLDILGGR